MAWQRREAEARVRTDYLDCCDQPTLEAVRTLNQANHDAEALMRCTHCQTPWYRFHEYAAASGDENRLLDLERLQRETQATIETVRVEQARARQTIGQPFPHREQLAAAREQVRQLAEELQTLAKEQDERTGDEHAHEPNGSQHDQDPAAQQVESRPISPADAARWSPTIPPTDQRSAGDVQNDLSADFDS